MTKEELRQYRSIVAELNEVNDRINSNTVHGTVTGSDSEFPYVKHCMSVSGVTSEHSDDIILRQRLEQQNKRLNYLSLQYPTVKHVVYSDTDT